MNGNLDLNTVVEVERLALQSWPGLEIHKVDGWLLRYAAGITRRANSVWPNEMHGMISIDDALLQVESFYHERDLPARFQICPAAQPTQIDELLAQRGYRAVARTAVQTTKLAKMLGRLDGASVLTVEVTPQAPASWWACYAKADEVAPESVAARRRICSEIKLATAYATVLLEGAAIAVGSAAAGAGWMGFFNIATLAEHRRIGAGRAVMRALGQWGEAQGATNAYLQVMADNDPALRLYGRLGFATGYYYHYREDVRSL